MLFSARSLLLFESTSPAVIAHRVLATEMDSMLDNTSSISGDFSWCSSIESHPGDEIILTPTTVRNDGVPAKNLNNACCDESRRERNVRGIHVVMTFLFSILSLPYSFCAAIVEFTLLPFVMIARYIRQSVTCIQWPAIGVEKERPTVKKVVPDNFIRHTSAPGISIWDKSSGLNGANREIRPGQVVVEHYKQNGIMRTKRFIAGATLNHLASYQKRVLLKSKDVMHKACWHLICLLQNQSYCKDLRCRNKPNGQLTVSTLVEDASRKFSLRFIVTECDERGSDGRVRCILSGVFREKEGYGVLMVPNPSSPVPDNRWVGSEKVERLIETLEKEFCM